MTQDAWKTTWKEDGRDAPSFVSLGADGSYFMRTVKGGGSWDLKAKEREEGMKGTNKFLEDLSDFNGVAVSVLVFLNRCLWIYLFFVFEEERRRADVDERDCTSSPTTQLLTSCFSRMGRRFPISRSRPGMITTRWLPRCRHLCRAWRRSRVCRRLVQRPSLSLSNRVSLWVNFSNSNSNSNRFNL